MKLLTIEEAEKETGLPKKFILEALKNKEYGHLIGRKLDLNADEWSTSPYRVHPDNLVNLFMEGKI